MSKETGEKVSAIAAKYLDYQAADLMTDFGCECATGMVEKPVEFLKALCADIRTMAGSCLSQRSDAND